MGDFLILDILMQINGVISTVLNFVVIYMVLFKSPLDIKSYKWFLLNNAIWDLIFNILVSFLYMPEPLLANMGGALIVTSPLKILGLEYARWISLATIGALVGSCAAVSACFVFRFFCLQSLNTFNTFLSIRVLGPLCSIYGLIIVITLIFANAAIIDTNIAIEKFVSLRPNIIEEAFIAFDIEINPSLITAVIWAGGGVSGMTTINIGCSLLIVRQLNSLKTVLSSHTYKMHKQLMFALILQTVCPMAALIIPFSVMVFSSVLKIHVPFGSNWFIYVSTLNAILNPLFTLYFCKAYWNQIMRCGRPFAERVSVNPISTVISSANNARSSTLMIPSASPGNTSNPLPLSIQNITLN